jgi:hypothetical protein
MPPSDFRYIAQAAAHKANAGAVVASNGIHLHVQDLFGRDLLPARSQRGFVKVPDLLPALASSIGPGRVERLLAQLGAVPPLSCTRSRVPGDCAWAVSLRALPDPWQLTR